MPVTFHPADGLRSAPYFTQRYARRLLVGQVYPSVEEALDTTLEKSGPHGHGGELSMREVFRVEGDTDEGYPILTASREYVKDSREDAERVDVLVARAIPEEKAETFRDTLQWRGEQAQLRV